MGGIGRMVGGTTDLEEGIVLRTVAFLTHCTVHSADLLSQRHSTAHLLCDLKGLNPCMVSSSQVPDMVLESHSVRLLRLTETADWIADKTK
jgi:hypothetical protein